MKRARAKQGSVVLDKRIKAWNFFWWADGNGPLHDLPTKAAAWKAAKPLRDAVEERGGAGAAPTMNDLVVRYRNEKMPKRIDTRRAYEVWLSNHILPKWGGCLLSDVQARPVELWLDSLRLAPKSKAHIRGLLSTLWDYAMWRGDVATQRNPIELVSVKGATKRTRRPRSLSVEEFRSFAAKLDEPFRMIVTLRLSGLADQRMLGVTLVGHRLAQRQTASRACDRVPERR